MKYIGLDCHKQYDHATMIDVMSVAGAILIWGSITPQGRTSVINDKALAEVLSLEEITNDLLSWGNQLYLDLIQQRASWCQHLFDRLAGKP